MPRVPSSAAATATPVLPSSGARHGVRCSSCQRRRPCPVGRAMPLRGRALVLRTEPRRGRVSALAGFDPYRGRPAGLTPLPRPRGCAVTAEPRGRGGQRPAARAGRRCGGASGRGRRAGHRPLPASEAFARGGGSSQTSSPGNTMPLTRLPSVSTARKTLAEPEGDARWRGARAGPRGCGRWPWRCRAWRRSPRSRPGTPRTPRPRCCAVRRRRR